MNFTRENFGRILVLAGMIIPSLPFIVSFALSGNYSVFIIPAFVLGGAVTGIGFCILYRGMRWSYFLLIGGLGLLSYFFAKAFVIFMYSIIVFPGRDNLLYGYMMLFILFLTPFGAVLTIAGAFKLIKSKLKK